MSRQIVQGLIPQRKLLLGWAAALAIAIPLAWGTAGCASEARSHGAEATNGQPPWYKTAAIKRNDAPAAEIGATGNEFVASEPAINMIRFAYGEKRPLKPAQVLGGPDWMKTEVFHIDAELPKSLSDQLKPHLHAIGPVLAYPPDLPQTDAIKQVFRSLLIHRFKLRVMHETKVLPVFELVLAKNGPKFAEDKTADRSCRITGLGPGKGLGLDVTSCDFSTFLGLLSIAPELRRRVLVDDTGLHGHYSLKLHWTPKRPPGMPKPARGGQINPSAAPPAPSRPPLLTALRRQLGLEVVPRKAPVDVIVIEHMERPTPN